MSGMLLLALLIVVVSGLVAYVGDIIGRKMGRKRLTLFGMRPRHTAIVISVAAGMIIAILTLSAAFVISKPVRDAFVVPISKLRTQLDDISAKLNNTEQQLKQQSDRASAMTTQLDQKTESLTQRNKQLQDFNRKLNETKAQLQQTGSELKSKQEELAKKQQELQSLNKRAQDTIAGQYKKIAELNSKYAELNSQLNALTVFFNSNFTPLAFAKGQEILSGLFPTRGSIQARKALLKQFFAASERTVRQQCQQLPAKENALIFLIPNDRNKTMVHISEDDAIARLSEQLGKVTESDKAILRLAPANNVPVNGQALILLDEHLDILPNSPVYYSSSKVASIDVDVTPQMSSADILGKLVDNLLRDKIPAALRKDNMPMILRRFDPNHTTSAPVTSLSLVSWADLMAATEKARALSGKVTITARSGKSITRFDPLVLTLDVARTP